MRQTQFNQSMSYDHPIRIPLTRFEGRWHASDERVGLEEVMLPSDANDIVNELMVRKRLEGDSVTLVVQDGQMCADPVNPDLVWLEYRPERVYLTNDGRGFALGKEIHLYYKVMPKTLVVSIEPTAS